MQSRSSLLFAASLSVTLVLAACGDASVQKPVINFIGIGTGTLATDINAINFTQAFEAKDRDLIAVVSFAQVQEGTAIQATWFSPDERSMPLGRTQIKAESGAHIMRFSFASKEAWKPAPYLVRIDAMAGKGDAIQTASGSLPFFIGMQDEQIRAYLQDYGAWLEEEQKRNANLDAAMRKRNELAEKAAVLLGMKYADVVLSADFIGRGKTDYVMIGRPTDEQGPPQGGAPGVLFAGKAQVFAVTDGSGSALLLGGIRAEGKRVIRSADKLLIDTLPKDAELQLAILPSGTVSVSWVSEGQKICTTELRGDASGIFTAAQPSCR